MRIYLRNLRWIGLLDGFKILRPLILQQKAHNVQNDSTVSSLEERTLGNVKRTVV